MRTVMGRHVVQPGANARDRISQLPAEILDHIMGLLPIRQAAKVAVLSKVWRDVWSSLTLLCFDHGFFHVAGKKSSKEARKDKNKRSRFHVITQILLQHKGSIRKFVCFHALAMTEIVRFSSLEVDEWLVLVTRKGVEEIHLHFGCNKYKLPGYVFSCTTLKTLHLNGFSIDPQNSPHTLPNATSLRFDYADFGTYGGSFRLRCPCSEAGEHVVFLVSGYVSLWHYCKKSYQFDTLWLF
ncbi:unnamed protein product [Cuscuta campestris]|uniref:F-box domain-containing protein n=1 Tax=Cuscuta campestris TaxID=132261 RepID=A0A484N391_9ASTE|nr:unnamed protein product [Cuscuta campestris]